MGVEILESEVTEERVITDERYKYEDGDKDKFSHYVPKDQLESAIFNGTPCIALCGKAWVPTRDAERFPVCPECKEAWEALKDE